MPSDRAPADATGVALRAVALPPPEAASAIAAAWDESVAVLPLDPRAPMAVRHAVLARLGPTELLDGGGRHAVDDGRPAPAGTAAVVATSGTTGEPKGVVLSTAALTASAAAVSDALGAGAADRWLCCVPLHHVAGLSILARARLTGSGIEVHPGFDLAAVTEAAGRCTLVSLVPTTLARLLDDHEGRAAVSRFRAILLGGGPIPPDLLLRARSAGATVVTTYGLTETCGGLVHDGHPLPGVELRTDDVGEILVRGPVLLTAYRGGPDDPAGPPPLDPDGWFHTGDAGRLDPDGRLHVTDRMRDIVISGGVNVSPTAVERALTAHPGIADVAVAGAPDPEWGERVVAFVVADGTPPTLDALRSRVASVLGGASAPRQLVLVERIPRTASGKVLRRELRVPDA